MDLIYKCLVVALLMTCVNSPESAIIPDEITSLLSLIYSNIPPIKKGTDSRLGIGFALGRHADFQVMLELGPQTNTQPLGEDSGATLRRRQATIPGAASNAIPQYQKRPLGEEGQSINQGGAAQRRRQVALRGAASNAVPHFKTRPLGEDSSAAQRRRQDTAQPSRWLTWWNNALRSNSFQRRNDVSAPVKLRRVDEPSPQRSSDVVTHLRQLYMNNGATSSSTTTKPLS